MVAELERADHKETIEIRLVVDSLENGQERLRKEILINGVKKRAMDLHGRFNAVLFLPRDVQVNELRRGLTLTGPQRDDLSLQINGLELRHYGSRGQNRTAMLDFKLAQVDWLHQRTREQPVLLLDEVLAELDPQRRGYLLERLADSHQALLTAADIGMFEKPFLDSATVWTMSAGSLK